MKSLLPFWALTVSVVLVSMEVQKTRISSKISYIVFWRWTKVLRVWNDTRRVINNRMFRWNNPLIIVFLWQGFCITGQVYYLAKKTTLHWILTDHPQSSSVQVIVCIILYLYMTYLNMNMNYTYLFINKWIDLGTKWAPTHWPLNEVPCYSSVVFALKGS